MSQCLLKILKIVTHSHIYSLTFNFKYFCIYYKMNHYKIIVNYFTKV